MGDLESDIYMAKSAHYETIISIFFAKEGEFDQRALAEEKFDFIVEADASCKIIQELLKYLCSKTLDWSYIQSTNKILPQLLI